jgi:hypothetical protein
MSGETNSRHWTKLTSEIWHRFEAKDAKFLQVIDFTAHLTRAGCVRRHIPQLRVCDMCKFDFSENVVATMVCFQSDNHESISNLKTFPLKCSDVHTLMTKAEGSVDIEEFIRNRNFVENQSVLADKIKHNLAAAEIQISMDDSKFSAINEEIKPFKNERWDFYAYGRALHSWCLACHVDPERLPSEYKDRFMREYGDFFQSPERKSINELHDRIYSDFCSAFKAFGQRRKRWRTSEYSAYDFRRTYLSIEADYLCQLQASQDLQMAIIQQRPIYKEDILLFAMQQDAFGCHVECLEGELNHIYLIVFSTEHSCRVCLDKMDTAAELWKSRVNRACTSAVIVQVFYFTGEFRKGASALENFDPISFIPLHARGDFGIPTLQDLDNHQSNSELPTLDLVDSSDAVVQDMDCIIPTRSGLACDLETPATGLNFDIMAPVLTMLTGFKEQLFRWPWQMQVLLPQIIAIDSESDTSTSINSSSDTQRLFLASLARTSASFESDSRFVWIVDDDFEYAQDR